MLALFYAKCYYAHVVNITQYLKKEVKQNVKA